MKTSAVEADAVEPTQRRAVRGGLERDAPVAGVEHLAEEPLQVDRLGRRVRRRARDAADDPLDRARRARPPPGRLEHGAQQERRRRLPVRPRHPDDLERLRRLAEERVGSDGHRGASVVHEQLRDSRVQLERPLDDEGGGAGSDRALREVVPVGARPGHAEERGARAHAVGVVREVGDLDVPAGAGLARREHARQVVERHGRNSREGQSAAPRPAYWLTGASGCRRAPSSRARPAAPRGTGGRSARCRGTPARRRRRRRCRRAARRP